MLLYAGTVADSLFVPGSQERFTQLFGELSALRRAGIEGIEGQDDLLLVERQCLPVLVAYDLSAVLLQDILLPIRVEAAGRLQGHEQAVIAVAERCSLSRG